MLHASINLAVEVPCPPEFLPISLMTIAVGLTHGLHASMHASFHEI